MKLLLGSSIVTLIFMSTIGALRIPAFELNKPIQTVSKAGGVLSQVLKVNLNDRREMPENPRFCHGLDCPAYKVVSKTEDYEVREYDSSRWVSTQQLNMNYDAASGMMFMRLFAYIEGNNEKKEKIAMTAPVTTRVIPGQGPACKSNFTMSFFIAPKVDSPPAPSDKAVFLSQMPKQKVFVSSFPGIEHEPDWLKQAEKLGKALLKDKQKFDSSYFYTAGYDSPFRLLFRHNEIWFMATK